MSLNAVVRPPLGPADINSNTNTIEPKSELKTNALSKRKADEIQDFSEDDDGIMIDQTCDQVRRKIRTLLASGEMKVDEFQKAIGVSGNAYGRFMSQNGRDKGINCDTYVEAFKFFKKRELQGVQMPKKKVKKEKAEAKSDVSAIHLEGEETHNVPVFDSCDEVRKKIRAYLVQPSVTQAAFLREIAKTYTDGRKIQSKALNDFLRKQGASSGNTSAVFYSSYVFFEKIRLRDTKPKSKHRIEMEKLHPAGFDTKRSHQYVTCMVGEEPWEDQYGVLHIGRRTYS